MTPCNFTPATCGELTDLRISAGQTETRVEGLEKTQSKIESRLDWLLYFLVASLATSTGTLAVMLFGRR